MARAKRTDNKGRVLRTGEQQRSEDDRYLYRYTDLRGKKKTIYANTLVELREKEEEIQRDLADGIETSDLTLNELFEMFMETKCSIRETTRIGYCSRWKSAIADTLGKMKIANIKQIHIKALYAEMVKNGMSDSTIKLDHTLLSSVLEMAVENDYIRKNPAKGCRKGITGEQHEKKALTRAEQEALVDYVNGSERFCIYSPMITFALATGLRAGELVALCWHDVDFDANIVKIRRQLIYQNFGDGCEFRFHDLKTKAGRRDIPLTDEARRALIRQKEICLMTGREMKREAVEGETDFIFLNYVGKPFSMAGYNKQLGKIVDAYNEENPEAIQLPHISSHILRHTACSRMAEAGMEPKVLQYLMGHSNIAVTMDIYTHIDFSHIQEEVEEIEEKIKIG